MSETVENFEFSSKLDEAYARRVRRIVNFGLKRVCGLRIEGQQFLPEEGPFIVASGHTSNIDPFAIGVSVLKHQFMHFPAKRELANTKLIDLEKCGAYYLDRGDKKERNDAYQQSLGILEAGGIVCIFPTGTRVPNMASATVDNMKNGTARLSMDLGVPIIPANVNIESRRNKKIPPKSIEVNFGEQFTFDSSLELPEANAYLLHKIHELM